MSASSWRPFPAADPWPEVSGRCLDHARAVQAAEPLSWMSPAEIALHILRRRHQEQGTKRQRLPDLVQQPSYTTKRKHLACYDSTYLRCFLGLETSVIWNERTDCHKHSRLWVQATFNFCCKELVSYSIHSSAKNDYIIFTMSIRVGPIERF